jgi:nitrogen fixation/metabolism regulation signal transduction histidine kinase
MIGIAHNLGQAVRSLSCKTLLALAAVALPALAVAAILGTTLITAVSEAESDFENATSAARRLTDLRVLIEKEHGLIAHVSAELDLRRVERYAQDIADVGRRIDTEIASLAPNQAIVSEAVAREIRATRQKMQEVTDRILYAARSFAQSTALEQVHGPFETNANVLLALLDAITSNVDGIIDDVRVRLRESSQRAWRLTPIALVGALFAAAFGIWMVRRYLIHPVTRLTEHVLRIRQSGNLDIQPDSDLHRRADEIGTLSRSFNLMIAELADARRQLIESSEAEISRQYERLDAAINNMAQGLCMFDAEQKLIISNRRYADIYGLLPEHTRPGTPLRAILERRFATDVKVQQDPDFVSKRLAAVRAGSPGT